jgi:hypothetical protein
MKLWTFDKCEKIAHDTFRRVYNALGRPNGGGGYSGMFNYSIYYQRLSAVTSILKTRIYIENEKVG